MELHVGLADGVTPPPGFESSIRWKTVATSCHGPQARDKYIGHRVDGVLRSIGTRRFSTMAEADEFAVELAGSRWPAGTRLELEQVLPDDSARPDHPICAFVAALSDAWESVPAPRFEAHTTLPSAVVGTRSPKGPLAAITFFEMTSFVGSAMTVVTFVGEERADIADLQSQLAALAGECGVGSIKCVNEVVLGAWRPVRETEIATA